METLFHSALIRCFDIVASFIGSGINGNNHSQVGSKNSRALKVASFIGSGINGNRYQAPEPSLIILPRRFFYRKWN